MQPHRPIETQINEQTASRVFGLLDSRTPLMQIADDTGMPLRDVERLSTAKRLLDAGVDLESWPADLQKSWPKLMTRVRTWYERWLTERANPRMRAQSRHLDVLTELALEVHDKLVLPGRSSFLISGPSYWDPPLVPTMTTEPPLFKFEERSEFPWLCAHVPELRRGLDSVHETLKDYAGSFEALKGKAASMLQAAVPGLPAGVPLEALIGAVIVTAFDQASRPSSPTPTPQIEPGDRPGTVNVRVAGRVASALPATVGNRTAARFSAIVSKVLRSDQLQLAGNAEQRLALALEQARRVVGSESAIRKAISERECSTCLRPSASP